MPEEIKGVSDEEPSSVELEVAGKDTAGLKGIERGEGGIM